MSEHILRVRLEELETLRLTCRKCEAAVELKVATLGDPQYHDANCPKCNELIRKNKHPHSTVPDLFDDLARVISELQNSPSYTAQFILMMADKNSAAAPGLSP